MKLTQKNTRFCNFTKVGVKGLRRRGTHCHTHIHTATDTHAKISRCAYHANHEYTIRIPLFNDHSVTIFEHRTSLYEKHANKSTPTVHSISYTQASMWLLTKLSAPSEQNIQVMERVDAVLKPNNSTC